MNAQMKGERALDSWESVHISKVGEGLIYNPGHSLWMNVHGTQGSGQVPAETLSTPAVSVVGKEKKQSPGFFVAISI